LDSFRVRDVEAAEPGRIVIEWAESHMPVLMKLRKRFESNKPLTGLQIGACLHVTKETAVLVETMALGGAKVALCGSNPLSTQDDVAAALARHGTNVFAWKGQTSDEYYSCIRSVLGFKPQITLDDGADLVSTIHKERTDLISGIIGGTEETTTGVVRLRAMARENALKYPIVAVNDAQSKSLFDNPLGTGQSALDGIIRATNVLLAGKDVVVVGYGRVGSGIAERAKGHGARITIVESNPINALRASMAGFRVTTMIEAAKCGDIIITATGDINVVRKEHFQEMKDKTILANAGHFDVEISKPDLEEISAAKRKLTRCIDEYTLKNGCRLFLLAEGRLVNLGCAEGHPSEVMDLSFSIQLLSVEYLLRNKGKLPPTVIDVPKEVDYEVARLKLQAMGARLEELTEEQEDYLASWEMGTE
jgi:adenosylhomocysteinase